MPISLQQKLTQEMQELPLIRQWVLEAEKWRDDLPQLNRRIPLHPEWLGIFPSEAYGLLFLNLHWFDPGQIGRSPVFGIL